MDGNNQLENVSLADLSASVNAETTGEFVCNMNYCAYVKST